jgi:hypothetical protein
MNSVFAILSHAEVCDFYFVTNRIQFVSNLSSHGIRNFLCCFPFSSLNRILLVIIIFTIVCDIFAIVLLITGIY